MSVFMDQKFCVFSAWSLFLQAFSIACKMDKCTLQTNPPPPILSIVCVFRLIWVIGSFLPVSGGYLILLITTHSSFFLPCLRIKRIPIFWKKTQNQRSTGYSFFPNLQRSSPEGINGFHEKTSGFVNGYLILFNFENHGYISTRVFDFREPWL